jgi:pyridoxine kinase
MGQVNDMGKIDAMTASAAPAEARPREILSIQSWVAYGHVGNAAAGFVLQRLGFEAWMLNTVQLSNHPGHGGTRGRFLTPAELRDQFEGIAALGILPGCAALLTGYLGDAGLGDVVIEAAAALRAANPAALWCCDPVMGDEGGGFYVRPGLPDFFRDRAIPAADIVTPNHFELEYLTGMRIHTLDTALAAAAALRARGPRTLLLTSLRRSDAAPGTIEMLVSTASGAWLIATPLLEGSFSGAGDALAALFLTKLLDTGSAETALEHAAAAIFAVLTETRRLSARELQLIAAQDELARPTRLFPLRRVA